LSFFSSEINHMCAPWGHHLLLLFAYALQTARVLYGFQLNTSKSPTDFLPFPSESVAFPTRSARIDSFRNQLEWVLLMVSAATALLAFFVFKLTLSSLF
jgi:hypothetical protein